MRRLALGLLLVLTGCEGGRTEAPRTATVRQGRLEVSSLYDGTLEARRVEKIMPGFAGGGVVTELVPEGRVVTQGEVVVRFDDAQVRRELLRLQRDAELARLELDTLQHATLPMESDQIESQLGEARENLAAEQAYLDDCLALVRDGLMTEKEVDQQRERVKRARSGFDFKQREFDLMRTYTWSSRVSRARASLQAADQELVLAAEQVSNCVLRAPVAGMVVHTPAHIGTEFRIARVGDTVFKNQPILAIPDLSDWIVTCHVPEVEVDRVANGRRALVLPLAYDGLVLTGAVEAVSTMAQPIPGEAGWAKFFRVILRVDVDDELRGRLRSGMSVQTRIVALEKPQTLLVPRAAVRWENGAPYAVVLTGGAEARRALRLGAAGEAEFEVLDGLTAGDEVRLW